MVLVDTSSRLQTKDYFDTIDMSDNEFEFLHMYSHKTILKHFVSLNE